MLWKEALKRNMEKTTITILSGEEGVEVKVEGIKLERVTSFKYLGVPNSK